MEELRSLTGKVMLKFRPERERDVKTSKENVLRRGNKCKGPEAQRASYVLGE